MLKDAKTGKHNITDELTYSDQATAVGTVKGNNNLSETDQASQMGLKSKILAANSISNMGGISDEAVTP